jgi:two-component sensor histidine kinase
MTMGQDPADAEGQAVLLADVRHQVRNTLATMRMIARRSAECSETLDAYAAHLDGRLAALARVQNVILQNATAGIDLGHLVTDELVSARAYQDERSLVEGPEVRLDLSAAEALALALHELTTNALKFGALASPSGRLSVTWGIADRDGESRLVFDWVESGVVLDAQAPRRHGFGTVVLREMLAQTLKAEVNLTFASDGLACRIVMPLTERVLHGGA